MKFVIEDEVIDIDELSQLSDININNWIEFFKFLQLEPFVMTEDVAKLCDKNVQDVR